MMMQNKYIILVLFLLLSVNSFGETEQYNFKRKIEGISEIWHKIILPNDIFSKVSEDLSDLRIIGICENGDTIEAPYILKLHTAKSFHKETQFKVINKTYKDGNYYFTFKIPKQKIINQISLSFEEDNFDWRATLQGGQNQPDWYKIIDNYRIVSIKNEHTDYSFTTLQFPDAKFQYFRLVIKSKVKPTLLSAKIVETKSTQGIDQKFADFKMQIEQNKKLKQSEIYIELPQKVPISSLKINVNDSFDYYRRVTIESLADSVKTKDGWIYYYDYLSKGTLSSLESNVFRFKSIIIKKIRFVVENNDNPPLDFATPIVRGDIYTLTTRFTKPADYYLVYGNRNSLKPNYDINLFQDRIPKKLKELSLNEEEAIQKKEIIVEIIAPKVSPLIKNEMWLWIAMGVVILTLGWFSIKMIKTGDQS